MTSHTGTGLGRAVDHGPPAICSQLGNPFRPPKLSSLLHQGPLPREWIYPITSPLLTAFLCFGLALFRGGGRSAGPAWISAAVGPENASWVYFALVTTLAWAALGAIVGRKEDELLERSRTDVLTSIANRRSFEERLAEEIPRAVRAKAPLSLLVIDLDELKIINDFRGHSAATPLSGWSA